MKIFPSTFGTGACLTITLLMLSCAHIPKESVYLSEELTGMIRSAEASHLEVLDRYMELKHQEADSFLSSVWIPCFLETGIKDTKLWDILNAEPDSVKKTLLMQEFITDANDVIFQRRASLHDALNKITAIIKHEIQDHYSHMLLINQSLTAHLRSATKVSETQARLLAQLNVPFASMIDIKKLSGKIDEVIDLAGKAVDDDVLKTELDRVVEDFIINNNNKER